MPDERADGLDPVTEVVALHTDLAEWLGTDAPPEVFDRFAAAQHADFSMVTATGEVVGRIDLLDGVHSARNAQPGLTIDVSDVEAITCSDNTVVVRFLEEHHASRARTCRRVTAILVAEDKDWRWLSVHETLLAT